MTWRPHGTRPRVRSAALLDNSVDHAVASLLRTFGHTVVAASEVGIVGAVAASDDDVTVYAIDRGMVA